MIWSANHMQSGAAEKCRDVLSTSRGSSPVSDRSLLRKGAAINIDVVSRPPPAPLPRLCNSPWGGRMSAMATETPNNRLLRALLPADLNCSERRFETWCSVVHSGCVRASWITQAEKAWSGEDRPRGTPPVGKPIPGEPMRSPCAPDPIAGGGCRPDGARRSDRPHGRCPAW
jgi:hypothetical protein